VISRPEEGGNHREEHEHEDNGRHHGDQQELACVPHGFRIDRHGSKDRGACGGAWASRCRQPLAPSAGERTHRLPRLPTRRTPRRGGARGGRLVAGRSALLVTEPVWLVGRTAHGTARPGRPSSTRSIRKMCGPTLWIGPTGERSDGSGPYPIGSHRQSRGEIRTGVRGLDGDQASSWGVEEAHGVVAPSCAAPSCRLALVPCVRGRVCRCCGGHRTLARGVVVGERKTGGPRVHRRNIWCLLRLGCARLMARTTQRAAQEPNTMSRHPHLAASW